MKNKWLKRIGIGALALIVLWLLLRISGILQFHTVPTSSNAPSIMPGDQIIVTNLANYKRFDFVCYNQTNPKFDSGIWMKRVCGTPGDEILIENGTLFVNGKNVDKSLAIMHYYYLSSAYVHKLKDENNWPICGADPDSCRIAIVDSKVTKDMNAIRYIDNKAGILSSEFKDNWTLDNFGPFIIPKGSIFVLGDNRHNSLDSRIVGLISEKDIVGVVITWF